MLGQLFRSAGSTRLDAAFGLAAAQRGSVPAAATCQRSVVDEDSAHAGVMLQ